MNMTVNLNQQEVEKIVREHLAKKFESVGEIKINVGHNWVGYGQAERQELCFEGMTCEVEMAL